MRKYFYLFLCLAISTNAIAATNSARNNMARAGRPGFAMPIQTVNIASPSLAVTPVDMVSAHKAEIDRMKKECMDKNVGVRGDTFVWADINADGNDYYRLTENTDDPAANTCWVKIDLTSTDPRVAMANIRPKYYPLGQRIECGSWADEKDLQAKILNAKKTGRTLGTVAGAVGGAAVGVGAMELFGNKMIGGRVMGQKSLSEQEFVYSNMTDAERTQYARVNEDLESLCNQLIAGGGNSEICN